jgi:3-deoxy-manno-octulosonate cytidylyltransferase (CMP-KDO synthetase)
VVNVQGDEPLIDPVLIHRDGKLNWQGAVPRSRHWRIRCLKRRLFQSEHRQGGPARQVATPCIFRARRFPMRAIISPAKPAARRCRPAMLAYRHMWPVRLSRAHFLRTYTGLAPSPLETLEALEQLRALWHGYRISVAIAEHLPGAGVDTLEDARRCRNGSKTFDRTRI